LKGQKNTSFFTYSNLKCYFEQKTELMNKYVGAVLLFALFSCRNTDHHTAKGTDSTETSVKKTSDVSLKDPVVQAIYSDYILLKNALVDTKYEEAKQAAKELSGKLAAFQGCENTALIANKINAAKNIEEQRKEFTFLSSDVIALFRHADLKSGTIYVQHCPMANHGDGGDWVSSETKIQNPYYGKQMMECGAVMEEFKSK
jgi:hypothetical protein